MLLCVGVSVSGLSLVCLVSSMDIYTAPGPEGVGCVGVL